MRNDTGNEVTEDEDGEAVEARVKDATEYNEQGPNDDPTFPELELGTVSHRQELGCDTNHRMGLVLLLTHYPPKREGRGAWSAPGFRAVSLHPSPSL